MTRRQEQRTHAMKHCVQQKLLKMNEIPEDKIYCWEARAEGLEMLADMMKLRAHEIDGRARDYRVRAESLRIMMDIGSVL